MLPVEQSLSMFLFAARAMDRANAGDKEAADILRILTPLLKFRACRDNIPVATGAMEVRGGNGYIEEWVNPRLVRDAHIGVLWEGTSNINALDIITRAVGKSGAHRALAAALGKLLDEAAADPRGVPRPPARNIAARARFRRARRRRAGAGSKCAARRERPLSHRKRGADGLGSEPTERRRAPRAAGAAGARASPGHAGSAGAVGRRLGRRAAELLFAERKVSLAELAAARV